MFKILVIRDVGDDSDNLVELLTVSGYEVHCYEQEEGVIQEVKKYKPDLVVLSTRNHLSVCRVIRENIETSHIMVAVVSFPENPADIIVALEIGADGYINKPFAQREFLAKVAAILRRRPQPSKIQQEQISFGKYTIYTQKLRVVKQNKPGELQLPKKVFELLVLLARNKNTVVLRQEILDVIWDGGHYRCERTIDVYIRKLRSAIEEDPSSPQHIITNRGKGYSLVD